MAEEQDTSAQIQRITSKYWKKQLNAYPRLQREITRLIDKAVSEALAKGKKLTAADIGALYKNNPSLRTALNKAMNDLNKKLHTAITAESKEAWLRANTAQDEIVNAMAANNAELAALIASEQNKPQNNRALRAFQQRETNGMNLSDRIWRATEGMRRDMERATEVALAEGVSAQKLSQRVRELLKEPHRLYRRVRDADGNLVLSQAAQQYHPGRGVYRSSYKNAMRVARTEINMAYQASDHERWSNSKWVRGIHINLSNNHTTTDSKGRTVPLTDICDELVGDYPRDFKFTGWHPQCRCFATALTVSTDVIRDYYKRKRAGEDMSNFKIPGLITEPPEEFKQWLADNADRLNAAQARGTLPYFVTENAKYTGYGVMAQVPAEIQQ